MTDKFIAELFHDGKLTDPSSSNLPSFVFPGTEEAFRRGCTCPPEENINRLKQGAYPKLLPDCRVHNKICQAERCGHGEHWGVHERCEHCTNALFTCVVCSAVYLEDGFDPHENGWLFVGNEGTVGGAGSGGAVVRGWRCRNCRS